MPSWLSQRLLACLAALLSLRGHSSWAESAPEPCPLAETAAKAVLIASPEALQKCNHKVWAGVYERTLDVATRPLSKTWTLRRIHGGQFMFPSSDLGDNQLLFHIALHSNDTKRADLNQHFFTPFPMPLARYTCGLTLSEPVLIYRAFAPTYFQFGHVMPDLLPAVFWAYTHVSAKILVQKDAADKLRDFFQWFDPKLGARMLFVPADTLVCSAAEIFVLDPAHWIPRPETLRVSGLYAPLRTHLLRNKRANTVDKVIAYERIPGFATTGRLLEKSQFERLVNLAADALRSMNKAPDSIVRFNGRYRDTKMSMSFEEQYRLFNSAYLMFGPHGAGMANSLWMQSPDCVARPAVIEFMCSTDTRSVRGCYVKQGLKKLNRPQTFWRLFAGAYWVRYFHVWMLHHDDHESDVASVDEAGFNMSLYAALEGAGPQARRLEG